MLTAVLLGFALGIRHAADPDHVAAIAALVARHRRVGVAARIGAAWGLGHSATIFAVGGALVALRIAVPPRWTLYAELAVAAILIGLGVANLRRLLGEPAHAHAAHGLGGSGLRAFAVGIAHGLGGSAAVALLALAAMPTTQAAVAYLGIFGIGTVGGMVALSLGLGWPLAAAGARPAFSRWVLAGSGALSIGVGLYLAYAVGSSALAL
ncbi:MAG: high-affinity nickel-transport family protein [Proteobacteria bacterium]|nr:MAG: high-affinity nickel-transport family protein [Pseudomonadota bacterium]